MLDRTAYFIRERVAFLKLVDTYDIIDPGSGTQLGVARERAGWFIQLLRFVANKGFLPTRVFVYEGTDPGDEARLLFSISRGFSFLRPRILVRDRAGSMLGWLTKKAFSLGGSFSVCDAAGSEVATVKGDWKGWNFRYVDTLGVEVGAITKKWAGIGKELFTSADNYIVMLNGKPDRARTILLLAAGLAVDTVLKE